MSDKIKITDILYLFERPAEPVYFPKGGIKSSCIFNVPTSYVSDRFQNQAVPILDRFGEDDGRIIDVDSVSNESLISIPFDEAQLVKRNDNFSLFIPLHRRAAGRLITIFMERKNVQELLAYAAFVRDRVNSELFVYALSTAILHRDDTKSLKLPNYPEIFPQNFISREAIADVRETSNILKNSDDRVPIEIPPNYTGNDGDVEHRLAYFREDIGINLHHWHWHLVYPFDGPNIIVQKDRRGELFYYLHHQILARYNVERLCNGLNLVNRLLDWDQPIEEGYFPMISTDVSGKAWPPRPPNMRLSNINRPDQRMSFDIDDMLRWKERIFEAIHKKKVFHSDGTEISIDDDTGIDVLGNMVEASVLTPNFDYYGDLHNNGHNALAFIHDPEYKYMQSAGVMSETTTAMRDPVFYRWHAFIDDLFTEHKNILPPYDVQTLDFPGIQVTDIELCSDDSNGTCSQRNILNTYLMKSDIDLSRGLDFTPRGPILVRITHLNHDKFSYTIKVNNKTSSRKLGTVRIFIAPALAFANIDISLAEQSSLMIEMDRFVGILEPGNNTIQRESDVSSVTIPFNQTFRNLDENRPQNTQLIEMDAFNYCGCGWPQHMLVPKGNTGGYPMILFVMISNYELDKIGDQQTGPSCRTGMTFCGLRDRKYPDKRPMGFPFDRRPRSGVDTLADFLTPNMAIINITVIHSDAVRNGNQVAAAAAPIQNLNVPPGATSASRLANINEIGE